MSQTTKRPVVAVHKFSSCDGCQLAFLNLGEALLDLAQRIEIRHFAEAGYVSDDITADIAFVEGSVGTPHEIERIRHIREHSRYLISIGACATAGGIQALRNMHDAGQWLADVYATPEQVAMLSTSTPMHEHVRVDLELWGCPPNGRQVVEAINSLLAGAVPIDHNEKVCLECKRRNSVCVLVAHGTPCMGPVTRTGCGALCPSFGRDCYGCYGPAENDNTAALGRRFEGLGLVPEAIARRFLFITNAVEPFHGEGQRWKELS